MPPSMLGFSIWGNFKEAIVKKRAPSRRDVLKASAALTFTAFAALVRATAPPAEAITPALIEAA